MDDEEFRSLQVLRNYIVYCLAKEEGYVDIEVLMQRCRLKLQKQLTNGKREFFLPGTIKITVEDYGQ